MPLYLRVRQSGRALQIKSCPSDFQTVSGPYNRTEVGHHVGGTYFALYDNQILTDFLNKKAIGFEEYTWIDVPAIWREPLIKIGLAKHSYDTGKLLNSLLIAHGHTLRYVDAPDLIHLGGTSFVPLSSRRKRWWSNLPGVSTLRRLRAERALHARFARVGGAAAEIQAETRVRLDQRNNVRQYFWSLLQALTCSPPTPPSPDDGRSGDPTKVGTCGQCPHCHSRKVRRSA